MNYLLDIPNKPPNQMVSVGSRDHLFNGHAMTTYKIFYSVFLLLIPALSYCQTGSDNTIPLKSIPDVELISVQGGQVQLSEMSAEATILFLLPKPASMSEGKNQMEDIRGWIDDIRLEYRDRVFSLLIVEPVKTSFPFYGIQKKKLKNESFPVVIDKDGEILNKFQATASQLYVLIINKDLDIMQVLPENSNEGIKQIIFDQLENLGVKSSGR